ncbi:MAG: hypothetical protein GWP08_14905 [Nitrospiraceae bacterium]|nr:hypothetical protein [Nitrospiraceae bacterium]
MLDGDGDSIRVHAVEASIPMRSERPAAVGGRNRRQRRQRRDSDEAKDHFNELAKEAEVVHRILHAQDSPYRLCVYRKGERVFIDVVLLNDKGAIVSITTREITHQPVCKWLQNMDSEEGLLLDRLA